MNFLTAYNLRVRFNRAKQDLDDGKFAKAKDGFESVLKTVSGNDKVSEKIKDTYKLAEILMDLSHRKQLAASESGPRGPALPLPLHATALAHSRESTGQSTLAPSTPAELWTSPSFAPSTMFGHNAAAQSSHKNEPDIFAQEGSPTQQIRDAVLELAANVRTPGQTTATMAATSQRPTANNAARKASHRHMTLLGNGPLGQNPDGTPWAFPSRDAPYTLRSFASDVSPTHVPGHGRDRSVGSSASAYTNTSSSSFGNADGLPLDDFHSGRNMDLDGPTHVFGISNNHVGWSPASAIEAPATASLVGSRQSQVSSSSFGNGDRMSFDSLHGGLDMDLGGPNHAARTVHQHAGWSPAAAGPSGSQQKQMSTSVSAQSGLSASASEMSTSSSTRDLATLQVLEGHRALFHSAKPEVVTGHANTSPDQK